MIDPTKPEKLPTIVLFGLISGMILVFPKFFPKKNAKVSHIHNDTNIARVKFVPAKYLKHTNELRKTPIHIKPKSVVEMLRSGLDDFLNTSTIMDISTNKIGEHNWNFITAPSILNRK